MNFKRRDTCHYFGSGYFSCYTVKREVNISCALVPTEGKKNKKKWERGIELCRDFENIF